MSKLARYVRMSRNLEGDLKTFTRVARFSGWSQERLLESVNGHLSHMRKANPSYPNWVFDDARKHWRGYTDAIIEDWTVFLYRVNGKFYRCNNTRGFDDMPIWEALPREMWDSLGDHGGIFWRETLARFH